MFDWVLNTTLMSFRHSKAPQRTFLVYVNYVLQVLPTNILTRRLLISVNAIGSILQIEIERYFLTKSFLYNKFNHCNHRGMLQRSEGIFTKVLPSKNFIELKFSGSEAAI